MRRLLAILMILIAIPAMAADNTVILTPGSGVTMRTQDVGSGVQSPYNILGNTSGTAIYGTAGTSNVAVLSVQGIASGTALPVSLTSTTITGTVAATQSGTWTIQPGNTPNTTPWLVTLSGTNTVTTVSTVTSLSQFAGAAINLGAGAIGTGTLRITQASDSPEIAVLGAAADAASTAGGTGTLSAKLRLVTTQLDNINTNIQGAINTGTNVIGYVGGDGTAGTASTHVLSVQGIASMTPILATLSGTNNIATVTTVSTVTNLAQMNGAALLMGNGVTGTGSQRVTIASDNTAFSVNSTLSAETAKVIGTVRNADGSGNLQVGDPCQLNAKVYLAISQTTNTQLFTGTSAKKTYVCHILVVGADAENISLVSGTGTVCATSTAAMIGSTTAAAGPNLSANGGFSVGQGGFAVAVSAVNADNVCLFQSGSGRVAGVITYVAQ